MRTTRSNKRAPLSLHAAALLLAAGALPAMACSASPTAGDGAEMSAEESEASQPSDASITSRVEIRLAADPEVNNFEIDVDTTDGHVRLSGTVETEKDREEAGEIARLTEGVKSVANDLQLGDPTFKENVDDAWIATKITAKLTADPDVSPFPVDVDVVQGVVTLTGTVEKEAARKAAHELAVGTEGVKEVKNLIKVESDG